MPRPTNTERIDDIGIRVAVLSRDVEQLAATLRDRTDDLRKHVQVVQEQTRLIDTLTIRLNHVERSDPSLIPVLVQRVVHLEKVIDEGRTRRWQVWLAFVSAALSTAVALIVAFVRR